MFTRLFLSILACVCCIWNVRTVCACVDSDVSHLNFTSRIFSVEPANTAIKHQVGGSVKILSGCSFFVRNMTIIPTGNSAYWWGVPSKNNTDLLPRVVASALGSYNGQSVTFQLDPQFSFDDITIMEIRSEGDNRAYGAFSITGNIADHYKITATGPGVDFDPTKPWNGAKSKYSLSTATLFLPLLIAML